jgi:hypothetical protein
MAPHEAVFVPNQAHHQDIENGKDDQPGSVRVRKAVELIDDKQSKYDQGCRIRPEFVPQQSDYKKEFHNTVA